MGGLYPLVLPRRNGLSGALPDSFPVFALTRVHLFLAEANVVPVPERENRQTLFGNGHVYGEEAHVLNTNLWSADSSFTAVDSFERRRVR